SEGHALADAGAGDEDLAVADHDLVHVEELAERREHGLIDGVVLLGIAGGGAVPLLEPGLRVDEPGTLVEEGGDLGAVVLAGVHLAGDTAERRAAAASVGEDGEGSG